MAENSKIGNTLNLWLSNFRLFIMLIIFIIAGVSSLTYYKFKIDDMSLTVQSHSSIIKKLSENNAGQKVLLKEIKADQIIIQANIQKLIDHLIN